MKYLPSKDSVSFSSVHYSSNNIFHVDCFHVSVSFNAGSAAPKAMPPPAPGMGPKGPPFSELSLFLKHK